MKSLAHRSSTALARQPAESDEVTCLRDARGYRDEEIYALAEMGYHYLRSGGLDLACVIFEGLAAIDPTEPYFALALGLAAAHLGDRVRAAAWYQRACLLDPRDPRAELNLAELAIESGQRSKASKHLHRALQNARARADEILERKALALIALIDARRFEVAR